MPPGRHHKLGESRNVMLNADLTSSLSTGDAKPASRRAGAGKLIFWALLGVIIVASASFWLTQTPEDRQALRREAADKVNSLLEGTPMAGLGNAVATPPPPPPPEVTNPATDPGTLGGRTVTGTIAAPMDFGPIMPRTTEPEPATEKSLTREIADATRNVAGMLGGETPEEPVVFSQEAVPQVTEDNRVKAGYVANLAQWLARHYKPGPSGGSLNVSVQALNQECGVKLAGQTQGGRPGLLRYAFHQTMIDGLYRLYIDRFMADLQDAAQQRGFDADQSGQFYTALAGRAALLASAISGVLATPELPSRLARIDGLGQKVVDTNAELTTALFELDEQRENKAARQVIDAAQLRVNGATARYRRAADEHEKAQNELAAEIRRHAGPGLDEDALLFIAAWAARREVDSDDARAALRACVQTLHNLAARLRAAAAE